VKGRREFVPVLNEREDQLIGDMARKTTQTALDAMVQDMSIIKLMVPQYKETAYAMLVASHLARSVITLLRDEGRTEAVRVFKKAINDA